MEAVVIIRLFFSSSSLSSRKVGLASQALPHAGFLLRFLWGGGGVCFFYISSHSLAEVVVFLLVRLYHTRYRRSLHFIHSHRPSARPCTSKSRLASAGERHSSCPPPFFFSFGVLGVDIYQGYHTSARGPVNFWWEDVERGQSTGALFFAWLDITEGERWRRVLWSRIITRYSMCGLPKNLLYFALITSAPS